MVMSASNLSRSGLRDWLVQRVTAVFMAVYVMFIVGFLVAHPSITFGDWQALFSHDFVRISTLIFIFAIMAHAWIGMWTIFTDYVKCAKIRLCLHVIVFLTLLACLIWSIQILWS